MPKIRKRSKYDRARHRKRRPRTPAPTEGWVIRELARMTETTVRTLRNYVTAGLITPLELRGTSTRYARRELLRLLAVLRGRKRPSSRWPRSRKSSTPFRRTSSRLGSAQVRCRHWPPSLSASRLNRCARPRRTPSHRSSAGALKCKPCSASSCSQAWRSC